MHFSEITKLQFGIELHALFCILRLIENKLLSLYYPESLKKCFLGFDIPRLDLLFLYSHNMHKNTCIRRQHRFKGLDIMIFMVCLKIIFLEF